jgi:hypothetical protein
MKMSEFLALSEEEKESRINLVSDAEADKDDYSKATEDMGACYVCGKDANAGDYCFGCHRLVCLACFEEEPHLSECVGAWKGK